MSQTHQSIRTLQDQRGGVVILFAALLLVLLGLTALAVDLARLHLNKVELQNAADAAALAGALSLGDKQTSPGGEAYNWAAADSAGHAFAEHNFANTLQIQDALIETGYWNLNTKQWSDHTDPGVPASGDVPAVRATITIAEGQNSGPLKLFFAPLLGIDKSDMHASAVAASAPPAGGTGLFPFAISQCVINNYWDFDNNKPKIDPSTNEPYVINVGVGSVYHMEACENSGQWTSFDQEENGANYTANIMKGDFSKQDPPDPIYIDDTTYIQPGTVDDLYHAKYMDPYVNKEVPILVVDKIEIKEFEQVVAIAGFHITGYGKTKGTSYITGYLTESTIFKGLDPGNGNGVGFGALTDPVLVK